MAERKTFSRFNMRCGMVLRAKEGNQKLEGFDIPELDPRFTLFTANDIPGENAIYIFGKKIPLLASSFIAYKGQPLLVLFGPDYESTELALERIKVITSPCNESEEYYDMPSPLFYSWGLDENEEIDKEKETLKKVETTFYSDKKRLSPCIQYDVISWIDNGNIITECPTQWPELVKNTISSSLQLNPESIKISNQKYLSHYDEYLLTPALYAAFTSLATQKTKLPSEMREESSSYLSSLNCHITTWVDENNRPKHEEIDISVDQGAFALLGKEVQRQVMASILPKYNLSSFKAVVRTIHSPYPPSLFAGSSIYAFSSTLSSLQTSRLAQKAGTTPLKYILETNREATKFTETAPSYDLTDLTERVKTMEKRSDFDRKWLSSSLHCGEFGLQGFLSGIGISQALSIAGFSTTEAKDNQFVGQISYTSKKNVSITGSVPQYISQDKTLKDMVLQNFLSSTPNATLIFSDEQNSVDSGPDILSSYSAIFLSQLMKAAKKLSSMVEEQEVSGCLDLKFNSQNLSMPCEFEYSGHGVAVSEIKIPKTSLVPEVKKLWLDCSIVLPYNKRIINRIKSIALSSLTNIGAKLSDNFEIDIRISRDKRDATLYSSLDNTVKTLVVSSYLCALWQAFGEKGQIGALSNTKNIERYLKGGDSENRL